MRGLKLIAREGGKDQSYGEEAARKVRQRKGRRRRKGGDGMGVGGGVTCVPGGCR